MIDEAIAEALSSEQISAAMLRGLQVRPAGYSQLIAAAQRVIGFFQQQVLLEQGERLLEESSATPLIAAARTLQSVALSLRKVSGPPEDIRSLLILSGCAYAMHGNFPSACAVLNDDLVRGEARSIGEVIVFSICNPKLAAGYYSNVSLDPVARNFLQDLIFLQNTGQDQERSLVSQLECLMISPLCVSDLVFLRCARLALRQLQTLSLAKLFVGQTNPIFQRFVRRLIEDGRTTLLPPQLRLLKQTNLLSFHGNALLSLPTSSGKTLLAEFALVESLLPRAGLSVYVVPYIALGNQVLSTLQKHCPPDIKLVPAFGGYEGDTPAINLAERTIVVATPERFDLMLRTSNIQDALRLVVIDEAHLIENGVRGARLEGIISRLLLKQHTSSQVRLLLVSAVLNDISALASWLRLGNNYYHDSWRPTARRVAVWSQQGWLQWLFGNDALRPIDKSGFDSYGAKPLPLPQRMYPPNSYAQIAAQKPAYFSNVAFLSRYLKEDIGGPILVVCMTKANTRGIAEAIATAMPQKLDISPEREAIQQFIATEGPFLRSLGEMVRRGVAFHNSSLPPRLRGLIESAVRARAIDFVASTTTLAEGVDLPFRVSIVADWLMGYQESERPVSALLFRNIAGRCGRAGEFSEGDTVLFDNVLGGPRFTQEGLRSTSLGTLLLDPPPLKSSAFDNQQSKEDRQKAGAAMASQFLASVPEFPQEENLANVFALSLYANHAGQREATTHLIADVRRELLEDAGGEPLARAASPIRLTNFGIAANKTGLSPQTCKTIRLFLQDPPQGANIWQFCSHILLQLGGIPEQQNSFLRQLSAGKNPPRFYVTTDDLPTLAEGYFRNTPLQRLFASLTKAMKSKPTVSVERWAHGERSAYVEDQYDKFVDFAEQSFGNFLPWMMRSCGLMAPFGAKWAQDYDWTGAVAQLNAMRTVDRTVQDEQLSGSSEQ